MMMISAGIYQVELLIVDEGRLDHPEVGFEDAKQYLDKLNPYVPLKIGIRAYSDGILVQSAIIGSMGGGRGIHSHSQVIETDRLVVCCADSVFCLSIPDLDLIWQTQADEATCFEIHQIEGGYIVHGELAISRVDRDGILAWQRYGADIFTTPAGKYSDFVIEGNVITATDWDGRKYTWDLDGNNLV